MIEKTVLTCSFMAFCLVPYFLNDLSKDLNLDIASHIIVILFDESFNRVTTDEQMDIHIRY